MYGNNTSQVVKDVVTDLFKLKRLEAVKYSRKNESVQPFEAGGETSLEFYAERSNCGLFVLGSHSKKRPHNLVLGRFFDGRLLDCLELGVERYASIDSFGAAADAQLGNKVRRTRRKREGGRQALARAAAGAEGARNGGGEAVAPTRGAERALCMCRPRRADEGG